MIEGCCTKLKVKLFILLCPYALPSVVCRTIPMLKPVLSLYKQGHKQHIFKFLQVITSDWGFSIKVCLVRL